MRDQIMVEQAGVRWLRPGNTPASALLRRLLFLFAVLAPLMAAAQLATEAPLVLTPGQAPQSELYGPVLTMTGDASPEAAWAELRQAEPSAPVGISTEPVWSLLPLFTDFPAAETHRFHAVMRSYFLQSVTFYLLDAEGNLLGTERAGAMEADSWKRSETDRLAVSFDLAGERPYYLLTRTLSNTPLAKGLQLVSDEARSLQRERQRALYWSTLSILLAATVFSVVILMAHRGRTYIWLLAFHLQALVYFSVMVGYGHLIWPPWLFQVLSQSIMVLNFLFLFILFRFARSFLPMTDVPGRTVRLKAVTGWSLLVAALISLFVSDHYTLPLFALALVVVVALVLRDVARAIRAGYWPGWILLLAMAMQALGGVVGTSAFLHALPVNVFTLNAYMVSTLVALGVLSFSVALRLRYIESAQRKMVLRDAATGYPSRAYVSEVLAPLWDELLQRHGQMWLVMVKVINLDDVHSMLGPRAAEAVSLELLQQLDPQLQALGWAMELPGVPDCHLCLINRDEAVFVVAPAHADKFRPEQMFRFTRARVNFQGSQLYIRGRCAVYRCTLPDEPLEQALRKLTTVMVSTRDENVRIAEYSRAMDHRFQRRHWLAGELQSALQQGALSFCIQPQYDLQSGCLVGGELLARWYHPVAGAIGPAEFIPLAEKTGLVSRITRHMLDSALSWLHRHPDADIRLALNLSAADLDNPDLLDWVDAAFERWPQAPHRLFLEITESDMMRNRELSLQHVAALKSRGVGLAIDDFGTGYSSLSYLSHILPDEIKIDRSFVERMHSGDIDRSIVQSVIQLAHSLRAVTVAEGIETAEQLQVLQEAGCHRGQGYYWHRPLDEAAFTALVVQMMQD
ncbi:EAL domain-containing protein [Natronospirillum operosum]|uniref:EAL domain-containing protein n=1 Tax=Natronospirillum operosum TaxID=2759953 RepID=UPI0014369FC4|nr:EAL domain-containing protein [Natronospirillum operosum]